MTMDHTLGPHSPSPSARLAPRWFAMSAAAVPIGILGQFLLAGTALFVDAANWGLHSALGALLALPIGVVAVAPLFRRQVRALRHWGGALGILYLAQIALIVSAESFGSGTLQALHVFNAGLLLVAALVVVAKIERSPRN